MTDKPIQPANTVETPLNRFMRIVIKPHWCRGSPLAWVAPGGHPGIAHFAEDGKVGQFNLAWWLLERISPPMDGQVYKDAPLMWVIKHAPAVAVGRYKLTELASFLTLPEWQQVVGTHVNTRWEAYGVTAEQLCYLARLGTRFPK